jgi:hypothetical protein
VRFAPLSANPKIEEIKPKYPNKMTIFFASVNLKSKMQITVPLDVNILR